MSAPRDLSALTARQASACEHAKSPPSTCKCRCAGAFHGVARGPVRDLPLGDPHHPDDEDPKERRQREAAEAQRRRFEMLAAVGHYDE